MCIEGINRGLPLLITRVKSCAPMGCMGTNTSNVLSDQQVKDVICYSFEDYMDNQDVQKVVDEICHAYKEDMLYNGSFKDEGIKYDVLFVTSDRGEELRDVTLQITAKH